MTQGGNHFLFGQNLSADGAVSAGSLAILGTGGLYRSILHFLVTQGGDGRFPHLAAEGALQRKQTIFLAGGFLYHGLHEVMARLNQIGQCFFRDREFFSVLRCLAQLLRHRGRELAVGNGQRNGTGSVLPGYKAADFIGFPEILVDFIGMNKSRLLSGLIYKYRLAGLDLRLFAGLADDHLGLSLECLH